jgi:hypothetical protein
MARVAIFRKPQVVQLRQHLAHCAVPAAVCAMRSPGGHHYAGIGCQSLQMRIVAWPYRVILLQHVGGFCRSVRKQVRHAQSVIAPGL